MKTLPNFQSLERRLQVLVFSIILPLSSIALYAALRHGASHRALGETVLVILGVTVLALFMARLLSYRMILRPVARLTQTARALGSGDLTARTNLRHGKNEIGELAAALDSMAISIQNGTMALESAERTLRDKSDTLQNVIDSSPLPIVGADPDGQVTLWSPAAEEMFGWTSDEVLGKPVPFVPPDHLEEFRSNLRKSLEGSLVSVDARRMRKDGAQIDIHATLARLTDASGTPVGTIGIIENVTERRRAEEQLRQAQKMEVVGRLTASVAHDFNNVLTVIQGNGQLLLKSAEGSLACSEEVNQILAAAERGASLTRRLLGFSRQDPVHLRPLDLNAVVADLDKMLRRLVGEDIRMDYRPAPGVLPIMADPGQIEQVVLNLAANARDAMPRGGPLTIETTSERLTNLRCDACGATTSGEYALLAVSDAGAGIPPEVRRRIFEPFFTTKEAGKGTGLGLATVYGIVEQLGGHIQLTSEVEKGTTFRIFFPKSCEPINCICEAARQTPAPTGRETVLVVEDDEMVRVWVCRVLRRSGYVVLEASDGREALDVARAQDGGIHLLLTDGVMPHLSGGELAERLRRDDSALRVLFMSGYPPEGDRRVTAREESLIRKPFTVEDLLHRVRSQLDAPPHPLS